MDRREGILVVEDENAIRAFAHRALTGLGYTVQSVATAEEAAQAFAHAADDIGLLFTDIRLPGESGFALVARLRAARPDLPVLLASGYVDQTQAIAQVGGRNVRFMAKPYSLSQMRNHVRELLAGQMVAVEEG